MAWLGMAGWLYVVVCKQIHLGVSVCVCLCGIELPNAICAARETMKRNVSANKIRIITLFSPSFSLSLSSSIQLHCTYGDIENVSSNMRSLIIMDSVLFWKWPDFTLIRAIFNYENTNCNRRSDHRQMVFASLRYEIQHTHTTLIVIVCRQRLAIYSPSPSSSSSSSSSCVTRCREIVHIQIVEYS